MSQGAFGKWSCTATAALPYVLAVLFALLALRGALSTDVVDPDAARHAMNGVFLHDLIRDGQIGHPVGYAKEYYSHFPARRFPTILLFFPWPRASSSCFLGSTIPSLVY